MAKKPKTDDLMLAQLELILAELQAIIARFATERPARQRPSKPT